MTAIASTIALDPAAVNELERSFRGQVVRPVDPTYDEQRKVWNGSIDRFPALIARCAGVADVRAAVRFARADRSAGRRPQRRPQLPRPLGLRRRDRHRSRPDERDPRRP